MHLSLNAKILAQLRSSAPSGPLPLSPPHLTFTNLKATITADHLILLLLLRPEGTDLMSGKAEFGPEMMDLGLEGGQMHKQMNEQNIVAPCSTEPHPPPLRKSGQNCIIDAVDELFQHT